MGLSWTPELSTPPRALRTCRFSSGSRPELCVRTIGGTRTQLWTDSSFREARRDFWSWCHHAVLFVTSWSRTQVWPALNFGKDWAQIHLCIWTSWLGPITSLGKDFEHFPGRLALQSTVHDSVPLIVYRHNVSCVVSQKRIWQEQHFTLFLHEQ